MVLIDCVCIFWKGEGPGSDTGIALQVATMASQLDFQDFEHRPVSFNTHDEKEREDLLTQYRALQDTGTDVRVQHQQQAVLSTITRVR